MEQLIEDRQIDEEINIAELEHELYENPEYWLYNAINELNKANNILFNQGNNKVKDVVKEALFNAKEALKRIKDTK